MSWDAIIYFSVIYGYTIGMVLMAIISHKMQNKY